jgi:hypothetical protein
MAALCSPNYIEEDAHVHVRPAHRQRQSQGVLAYLQALEVCSGVGVESMEQTAGLNLTSLSRYS